jgi:hypothetical protein
MAGTITTLDAGQAREELVQKAKEIQKANPNVCCWSDLLELIHEDISYVAKLINKSTAYVLACTIDDLEADSWGDDD